MTRLSSRLERLEQQAQADQTPLCPVCGGRPEFEVVTRDGPGGDVHDENPPLTVCPHCGVVPTRRVITIDYGPREDDSPAHDEEVSP